MLLNLIALRKAGSNFFVFGMGVCNCYKHVNKEETRAWIMNVNMVVLVLYLIMRLDADSLPVSSQACTVQEFWLLLQLLHSRSGKDMFFIIYLVPLRLSSRSYCQFISVTYCSRDKQLWGKPEESLGFFSPRPRNLKRLATPKSDQSRPANEENVPLDFHNWNLVWSTCLSIANSGRVTDFRVFAFRISYLTRAVIWWRSSFYTQTFLDTTTSTCQSISYLSRVYQ